jgi:glycosyltransferase involved in cell wall biosynthesis
MGLALLSHIRGDASGGAEKLFSDVAKILCETGRHEVICCFATPYDEIIDELGLKHYGIKIINTGKSLERIFDSKYSKNRSLLGFYHSVQLRSLVKKLRPELVFIAHEAFQPLQTIRRDNNKTTLIHYVHNPYEFVPDPSDSTVKMFNFFVKKYIINETDFSDIILVNSISTRNECIKRWRRTDCAVMYPAISINEIPVSTLKEDICVVLSRISPEKKIELAIEIFSSGLQKKKLFIVGYLARENTNYYQTLLALCRGKENIKILPNLKRDEVLVLLSKAKVFFHPMPNEHFGIAIVEAMAAGCLPVVHASSGPMEILANGLYGLIYKDKTELPELLNQAFSLATYFQVRVRNRAMQFDIKYFREKFLTIIKEIK